MLVDLKYSLSVTCIRQIWCEKQLIQPKINASHIHNQNMYVFIYIICMFIYLFYLWSFLSQRGFKIIYQNVRDTRDKTESKWLRVPGPNRGQERCRWSTSWGGLSICNVCCKDGSFCSCQATKSSLNFSIANIETQAQN